MKTYIIDYVVGNTYKVKRVKANSVEQACKKARLNKSIVDIQIEEYDLSDIEYNVREFLKETESYIIDECGDWYEISLTLL